MCIISLFQTMLGVDGGSFCVASPKRVYMQTGCVMTTTTVTTGRTSRTAQVSHPHFFLIIASSLWFICCCCFLFCFWFWLYLKKNYFKKKLKVSCVTMILLFFVVFERAILNFVRFLLLLLSVCVSCLSVSISLSLHS